MGIGRVHLRLDVGKTVRGAREKTVVVVGAVRRRCGVGVGRVEVDVGDVLPYSINSGGQRRLLGASGNVGFEGDYGLGVYMAEYVVVACSQWFYHRRVFC